MLIRVCRFLPAQCQASIISHSTSWILNQSLEDATRRRLPSSQEGPQVSRPLPQKTQRTVEQSRALTPTPRAATTATGCTRPAPPANMASLLTFHAGDKQSLPRGPAQGYEVDRDHPPFAVATGLFGTSLTGPGNNGGRRHGLAPPASLNQAQQSRHQAPPAAVRQMLPSAPHHLFEPPPRFPAPPAPPRLATRRDPLPPSPTGDTPPPIPHYETAPTAQQSYETAPTPQQFYKAAPGPQPDFEPSSGFQRHDQAPPRLTTS